MQTRAQTQIQILIAGLEALDRDHALAGTGAESSVTNAAGSIMEPPSTPESPGTSTGGDSTKTTPGGHVSPNTDLSAFDAGGPASPDSDATNKKRGHDDDDSVQNSIAKRISYPNASWIDFNDPMYQNRKVWAHRRQGLCEGLDWYKSYNASLYNKEKLPYGMMIDKEARTRDIVHAQVIITTIGGGRVQNADKEGPSMTRVSDQSDNGIPLQAFRNGLMTKRLVGVIVGNNHPSFKSCNTRYSVLDMFQITDIWAEKEASKEDAEPVRIWCVRLEKADLTTLSWWDKDRAHYAPPAAPIHEQVCTACGKGSKHILDAGWTCLNHVCDQFFLGSDGVHIADTQYNAAFLNERRLFPGQVRSILPSVPQPTADTHGSELAFREGRVCPQCGCCSARKYWLCWSCENCTWTENTPMRTYPAHILSKEMATFEAKMAKKRTASVIACTLDPTLHHRNLTCGQFQVSQFLLPNLEGKIIGSVTVFQASEEIRRRGPDALFDDLSIKDIGLQRNPVSCEGSSMEGWTRHFGQNWGATYKFGVNVQSKGFSEAPDSILKAVHRMKWAGVLGVQMANEMINTRGLTAGNVHNVPEVDFNECLSLGYMQGDQINYHDDGEKTVGPTVASLSLGSPAIMHFRPKARSGMSPQVIAPRNCPKGWHKWRVVADARDDKEAAIATGDAVAITAATAALDAATAALDAAIDAATADNADNAGDAAKYDAGLTRKTLYGDVLQFPLYHGDLLVMHGHEIHKHYEHMVVPKGMRRFALTSRYIDPATLTSATLQLEALKKGALPAHSASFHYTGDQGLPALPHLVQDPAEVVY